MMTEDMYYTKVAGYNVDPIDVTAGLDMLTRCGYGDDEYWMTEMVIQYSLALWARGDEEEAERKAIDKDFHGIDFTSWRMVLAHAIAEGTRKINA